MKRDTHKIGYYRDNKLISEDLPVQVLEGQRRGPEKRNTTQPPQQELPPNKPQQGGAKMNTPNPEKYQEKNAHPYCDSCRNQPPDDNDGLCSECREQGRGRVL